MTELIASLVCLWVVAITGWAAHEWGRKRIGTGCLFLALVGFSATAVFNREQHRERPQPTVQPDALMVKHVASSLPASSLEPVGTPLEPGAPGTFVASRNGQTYHSPECSHYVPYIRGPIWYASEEDAKADGKRPCRECMKGP